VLSAPVFGGTSSEITANHPKRRVKICQLCRAKI